MDAQARGWKGRRERSYLEGTGATEGAAGRRPVRPRQCGLWGRRPSSLRGLHDFGEAPVLRLRQRPGLDDADDVSGLRLVLLVVRVEALGAADDLLVTRVRLHRLDADDDRLVHGRRDDDAPPLLSPAALTFGLRRPRERLPLARLLTLRLGPPAALRPRDALALRLRRSDGGGLLFGRRFLALGGNGSRFRLGDRLDRPFRLGRLRLGHRRTRLLRRSLGLRLRRRLYRRLSLDRRFLDGLFRLLDVLLFACHLASCLAFVPDGEDAGDLAFRELQPRRVLQRSRRRLETQVEQLLPSVGERILELLVRHIPDLVSPQRDSPLFSQTSFSAAASCLPGEALPSRAAQAHRRART